MTSDDTWQPVFRRILMREAGAGADAHAIAIATRRLCEHYADQLTPLIGDAGAAAICARSLHVTERNVRGLKALGVSPQGDGPFARLELILEHQESTAAADTAVSVLVSATELLGTFIGHRLTASLLRGAWPEDFAGDAVEEASHER